ncbi:MAG: prepilin-type N-terminal cleavage/methylation domain-containing protein [Candidatus Omnitrophica bacterium]|nr:prepilin-type N-terminal cleavage/methylation domain-containing protein [Candidatus Omnitrophota bacterium]
MKKGRALSSKGFTLIEVLIVIVILAVLAGLAIPMYQGTVERARRAEALQTLQAIRSSEMRYYATAGTYTTSQADLDFDFSTTALSRGGQTLHYSYTVPTGSVSGFTVQARRNTADGGDGATTVTINQAGVVS